jgi:serine/threonine protein kinase
MAPEAFLSNYTMACDSWGFGILTSQLCKSTENLDTSSSSYPERKEDVKAMKYWMSRRDILRYVHMKGVALETVSNRIKSEEQKLLLLVKECLQVDYQKRPSLEEIFKFFGAVNRFSFESEFLEWHYKNYQWWNK